MPRKHFPPVKLSIRAPIWLRCTLLALVVTVGAALGQSILSAWSVLQLSPSPSTQSSTWLLFAQAVVAVWAFIVAPTCYWYFVEQQSLKALFAHRRSYLRPTLLTIALVGACVVVNIWLAQWNAALKLPGFLKDFEVWARQTEVAISQTIELLTAFDSMASLGVGLLVMAFIPAVGEELLFRGVLQNLLYQHYAHRDICIWVTAAIFSAIHGQLYGFVPRLFIGALLGYIYWWTKSLWFPMVGHFVNNALWLILAYLHRQGVIEQNVGEITSLEAPSLVWWLLWVGVALVLARALYHEGRSSTQGAD